MQTYINNLIEFACVAVFYLGWVAVLLAFGYVWMLFTWKGDRNETD